MQCIELRVQVMFDATWEQCHTMDYRSHSMEFAKLRYVFVLIYHTIDTCSEFQWTFALNSKKRWFWDCTFIRDNDSLENAFSDWSWWCFKYVSFRKQQFLRHFGIKSVTDLAHNSTGQAIMERYEMLIERRGIWYLPEKDWILFYWLQVFLTVNETDNITAKIHWIIGVVGGLLN